MKKNRSSSRKINSRSQKSNFSRPEAKYHPNETILIVCEGETEVFYFTKIRKEYRLPGMTVELSKTGTAPINVVEYTISCYESREGIDKVFCVFDKDEHSTYNQAITKLKNYNLELINNRNDDLKDVFEAITSVPCFEMWLLLHFKSTTKPYQSIGKKSSAKQVEQDLLECLPDYKKNSSKWFDDLHRKIENAKINAKKLEKFNNENSSDNPSTQIHQLIHYLTGNNKKTLS